MTERAVRPVKKARAWKYEVRVEVEAESYADALAKVIGADARIAALEQIQAAAWAATALHAPHVGDPLCAVCALIRALDGVEDAQNTASVGTPDE